MALGQQYVTVLETKVRKGSHGSTETIEPHQRQGKVRLRAAYEKRLQKYGHYTPSPPSTTPTPRCTVAANDAKPDAPRIVPNLKDLQNGGIGAGSRLASLA